MPARTAFARWDGSLREGAGTVRLGSGAFEGRYSFASRFEDGPGTNPEELIGAAHAGCFSMALTVGLEKSGSKPTAVRTSADVSLEKDGEGFSIKTIKLTTVANVPGLENAKFQAIAEETKKGCPVSKALAGTKIELR